MAALTGMGLLIKYVLMSGADRWEKYGENLNLSFWGLDRHQWGAIHLIIALIIITLIILHIILHWKLVVCIYKRIFVNKITRIFFTIFLSIIFILFIIFPFIINVEINKFDNGNGQHSLIIHNNEGEKSELHLETENKKQKNEITNKSKKTTQEHNYSDEKHNSEDHCKNSNIEIKGSMTLFEVSEKYNISANYIKQKLDIPVSTSNNERLGRLKKVYDFSMGDIEKIIDKYLKGGNSDD